MNALYLYRKNPTVKSIFLKMLIPTILMNFTTALSSFADAVIIGYYLDELSLSVVTYATPIYMIINTFAALFAVGGSIAMGIDAGKGDKAASNKLFSISVELLAGVGALLLAAGLLFGKSITTLLGAGPEVFDLVYEYSMIVMVGAPVFMLNIGLAFFVRNDGRPTLSMVGMFVSIFVDLVLNVVFIGFMNMGVAGAAYSTVLGQLIGALMISSHFLTKKNTLRFRLCVNKSVWRIVKNGASTALHFVYQFIAILLLNHFVVSMAGADGMIVYTVVFNLYTVSLAMFEGLSQTIQPMVSVFFGEQSHLKIKNTLRLAFITILLICGGVTVALEVVPQIVPILFGISEGALLTQSAFAVRIYATSMIIMTVNVVIGYYLQSIENNSMAAVLVSLRCCILFLGSAFVLGKLFGINGVWGAYTAAEVLTFVIFIVMTWAKRIKLKKTGIDADAFLLDRNVEKQTKTYVFSCMGDDFSEFLPYVIAKISESKTNKQDASTDAEAYLSALEFCINRKDGAYIEAEINEATGKVIIKDNLCHDRIEKQLTEQFGNKEQTEYSAVLGWNRLCLG